MLRTLKRLSLGIILIVAAGATLLYSDRNSRHRSKTGLRDVAQREFQVAFVEHASQAVLEEGARGIFDALAERGYADGHRIKLRRYNAEGDLATANSIAKNVVSSGNDLIISISTLSLQTVANANKFGQHTTHVFGLVSDPYGAGVGINRTNHLDHPPYMTGYGTMQPVVAAFKLARQMRPELKTVGLVWNPTESNSEAQTRLARSICSELGITLLEANADTATAVSEAAGSLTARGVEAIWVSGDVTCLVANDAVMAAAKRARIPVFSVIPPHVKKGAIFDLGADYFEVGRSVGNLAADVLDGRPTAEIPVENFVPEMLAVNKLALEGLRDRWQIPDEVVKRAAMVIDRSGTNTVAKASSAGPRAPAGRNFILGLAFFAPEPGAEICMKGIFDGLRGLGFEEGKNLEVRRAHAQAEIPNIPAILQNFDGSDVDLIVPMTTPVISAACGLVRKKPVVFTYCSDPLAAGVGQSFTNHLGHMTGVGSFPPVQDMVDFIKATVPGIQSVGTIYNASEANSRKVVEVARGLFSGAGIKLEEVTVTSSADVLQAAAALLARGVKAFYIQGDNTVLQAFDAVVKAANDARIPLFNDDPDFAARGALACVGLGYYQSGFGAAKMIARVLLGEPPANIPLENISQKTLVLNDERAKALGLKFPAEAVAEVARAKLAASASASQANPTRTSGKPASRKFMVDLLEYIDTPNVEMAREGVLEGFKLSGFRRGVDFDLRLRNAQGDMATLSSLVDAAVTDNTDLIVASTTPALQGALRRAKGRPIVFTLVANPMIAGAGKTPTDHLPFVTGSYASAPHLEALTLLKKCLPNAKRIGTLFVPAEVNSVYYKDDLLAAAAKLGFEVEIMGISSTSEVSDGALALCGRNIDVFCQISDNLTGSSFASIGQVAARARIPLLAFASEQVKSGAFLALSRDFHDNGVDSGKMAVRILRGENPATIPFESVTKMRLCVNLEAAKRVGLTIPDEIIRKADKVIR